MLTPCTKNITIGGDILEQHFFQEDDALGYKPYQSKNGKETKEFAALEWLAAMCSHVPNRGEQMVRYYGYYSNVCRGNRQKEKTDAAIPNIIESDTLPARRKEWARLIQKIYEVDPLTCPRCKGAMKIISVIDQPEVIKAILQHVGLWETQKRQPPKIKPPSFAEADDTSRASDDQRTTLH